MSYLMRSRNRAQLGGGASPGGALAQIDFVAGTYVVNGDAVTADQVVSDTGRISSSGLSVTPDSIDYLGAFAALLASADWTAVFEIEAVDTPAANVQVLVEVYSDLNSHVIRQNFGALVPWATDFEGTTERYVEDLTAGSLGVNRIALTRTAARIALSYNGGAVAEDTTAIDPISLNAAQGASHNKTGTVTYIRRIDVHAPKDNAELPALSAI